MLIAKRRDLAGRPARAAAVTAKLTCVPLLC